MGARVVPIGSRPWEIDHWAWERTDRKDSVEAKLSDL